MAGTKGHSGGSRRGAGRKTEGLSGRVQICTTIRASTETALRYEAATEGKSLGKVLDDWADTIAEAAEAAAAGEGETK